MNNKTLAQKFSQRHTKGKGSNLFIDGDTVYSYGYHFPLARHTDTVINGCPVVIVNNRDYSSSTQRHKSYVVNALKGFTVVYIDGCDFKNCDSQINFNNESIVELKLKVVRARTQNYKDLHTERINFYEEQNYLIHKL